MYSVGEFAKKVGKSVKTLQKWDRDGKLVALRTPTNRRYYSHQQFLEYIGLAPKEETALVIAYCRVSSASQKEDLARQVDYIQDFARNSGIIISNVMTDIGSGLNFKRNNFIKLLEMVECGKVKKLIRAHKDRLVRFGFEWFSKFCSDHGTEVLVINDQRLSPEQEVVQDLISIIQVFSSRVYGLRKYTKQISKEVA